ncbi:FlaG/FlaF family flagellin (archaellin) [Bacillus sp. SLBN-46]|nr:FlaG/FlaF family flagellin (archaellin) [Bacillus sp. SLBN-46]
MSFIRRKPIIFSTILFIAIVVGSAVTIYFKSYRAASNELPVQQLVQANVDEADIGEYIKINHNYWNEELCWGRSKDFNFTLFHNKYKDYIENLNKMIDAVDDPDLKSDFMLTHDLLVQADETKDVSYLIDVHRMFHDLDVKYNDYVTSDYFGVTKYGENN